MERGDEVLHLAFALVARAPQQFAMVPLRQVWTQQTDRGERHVAGREQLEHDGKPPRRASRFDAPIRRVFGEVQHLRAPGEERRAALTQIETPRVQFRERCDERRGRLALLSGKPLHVVEQVTISNVRERWKDLHAHIYHHHFFAPTLAPCDAIGTRNDAPAGTPSWIFLINP
ncbi:MAG TPA: hypothetical protein VF159_11135 [Gemmatimonadaceae bacterium]